VVFRPPKDRKRTKTACYKQPEKRRLHVASNFIFINNKNHWGVGKSYTHWFSRLCNEHKSQICQLLGSGHPQMPPNVVAMVCAGFQSTELSVSLLAKYKHFVFNLFILKAKFYIWRCLFKSLLFQFSTKTRINYSLCCRAFFMFL